MLKIREIVKSDNQKISFIIKSVLTELNYNIKGTAFYDKETDSMFEAYQTGKSIYYVAILNDEIIGGCGINPLKNESNSICELQKMYILPKARGKKIGKRLVDKCIEFATKSRYKQCYLETFPNMYAAINLYQKNGFVEIDKSLGNTCHYIFAHVDAGKTSITEQLLYHSGTIRTLGSVDNGNTQTDTLAIEKQRGITVNSSVLSFQWNDCKINLIDTPGHIDFSSETQKAFLAIDSAIVVISAVEGIQAQTENLINLLIQNKKPFLIFINKIDRIHYNPFKTKLQTRQVSNSNGIILKL